MKKMKINNRGFILVEMILALALLFVVIGLVYSIHFTGNKSFKVSRDIGFAQQDARLISEFLNKELKYSSTMSKDNYQEGRYFSIELEDNSDGTKTLIKTEYENDVLIKETKLLSRDWRDIEIELEQENRIISGLITIKLGNNTDYKLPITIPLENINTNSELASSITLSDINKVYYALPEDILVASAGDEEYNPEDGENEGNENGGDEDNGDGENDLEDPEYPE